MKKCRRTYTREFGSGKKVSDGVSLERPVKVRLTEVGMIQVTITYYCRTCGSDNIIRNGTNKCGNPQYHCKDCDAYRVLEPKHTHAANEKETILRACKERASMRGLERIFRVARQTVARWIKEIVQALPDLKDTLLPAKPDDVLELDELWSYVFKKDRKRWLWTAICRRTRQIVAFVIGDRSQKTCRRLWNKIPDEYKKCCALSATSGKRTRRSFPIRPIAVWVRKVARRLTWNVGTTPCASDWPASSARPYPFPSRMRFITCSPNGISPSTTWPYHLPCNHYLKSS